MAGEPESLSGETLGAEETLDRHVRRHNYDRLIMLSDGIFAIAITLAALEIKLPEHAATLGEMIGGVGRTLAAYAISFLIIAVFWVSSRDLFARLQRVDRWLTVLTLAMLCAVAIIPACAHVVYIRGNTDASFSFYALTMTTCGVLNTAMWGYAAVRPGLMRAEVPRGYRWQRIVIGATMPILFGTLFFVPNEQAVPILVPLMIILVVVRRVLLPRWMKRAGKSAT